MSLSIICSPRWIEPSPSYRPSYPRAGERAIIHRRWPAKRVDIFQASLLVEAVLLLHLLWCGWILLGWALTRGHRVLRTLHIASLIYAIVIELVPWPPCPLTVAETWLEVRAGIEPAHGPFLVRFLDAIVYPDLPEWLVVGCAVLVCVAILGVYLRRYLRRNADGLW